MGLGGSGGITTGAKGWGGPRRSNSPGKKPGMGGHSLLPGISLTQGLNPGLLHCRQIRYRLSHQGMPIKERGEVLNVSGE